MEPPGAHVPARARLTPALPPAVTTPLAVAAIVLAAASRGEALVLGALLLLLELGPLVAVAVAGALLASSWRWGSTSLDAWAGAQAVLGPAGGVGPATAAVGTWLAAAALVVGLGRRLDPARGMAAGVAAAAVLAGPGPGGDLPVRVAVAVGAAAAALGLGHLRGSRRRLDRALAPLAAALGAAALVLVGTDAPPWPPTSRLADVAQGLVVAAAAAGLAAVGALGIERAPWRSTRVPPIVKRPRHGPPAPGRHR